MSRSCIEMHIGYTRMSGAIRECTDAAPESPKLFHDAQELLQNVPEMVRNAQ